MSSTQTEFTPVELALGLLELPSLDGLTEEQVRGFTCIWDSGEKPLAEEAAVTLGPRRKKRLDGEYEVHPRGCPEHVAHAAYEALFVHCMGDCERCSGEKVAVVDGVVQEVRCEIAVTLRRLALRKGRL
ncbi:hypothetical protein ABZ281_46575 [Streptomyces sp. NPDC006265]|uniref:hypothetical protein n=1 Tax=Streptomyces sp. NPDC006265 TaxID=3156740 RepID=UPI0033B69B89